MSYFHVEGFLFWLLVGEFFAMLLKALFHRVRRWALHVQYMTKLAGGSLAVDVEAKYWNDKIHDPMYRSIWRWYYGNLWNLKHPGGVTVQKIKRRRLIKIAALISAILLISIALVSMFGLPNIVPAPVPPKTQLQIFGQNNLTLVTPNTGLGWVYDLNGTARADGNYSGGWGGLGMGIVRTDKSNADATVFLNVTSGTFFDAANNTTATYLYRVTYLVFDDVAQKATQYDIYASGGDTQFGYIFTVPAHGSLLLDAFFFFRAFNSTKYSRLVTMQPAFSGFDSMVGIDGGYNHVTYPCSMVALSTEMYPRPSSSVVSARC